MNYLEHPARMQAMFPSLKPLPRNLKYMRMINKLTQLGLATKSGVSLMTIERIEHEDHYPTVTILIILAKALNCTVSELLEGVE